MKTLPARAQALLVILVLLSAAAPATAVNLHLLVESGDGVALETVAVPDTGELAVARPDLVTVVLPFGIGQSGDLVSKGRRPARLVARVQDGQLRVEITGADGRGRALPPVEVADLARLDLRVNVTGSGGRQRAFVVRGNGPAIATGGPVLDMFGGKIPLAAGDWALTTEVTETIETTAHAATAALRGTTDCRWSDGLVFTQVTGSGGRSGRFVVDTAAGVTVVARDFLAPGTVIEPIEGIEHSAAGARVVPGVMGGAGGDVSGLLGAADIAGLGLGALQVAGVRANVMDTLPELGGAPVAGILGLDVLSRCGLLRLERGAGDTGVLAFDPAPRTEAAALTCPFTIVAKHLVLPALLDGTPASLVLDTGARGSLLPASLAAKAKLPPAAGAAAREFHGLDGRPLPNRPVQVSRLGLGSATAGPAVFFAGDLPALAALGLDADSGLLGNDLLSGWRRLEIDFGAQVVRLTR